MDLKVIANVRCEPSKAEQRCGIAATRTTWCTGVEQHVVHIVGWNAKSQQLIKVAQAVYVCKLCMDKELGSNQL